MFMIALQIKYNDEVKVVAIKDVRPSFILSQLLTDTTYNISVSATNSAGEGSYSDIITTRTLSKSMLVAYVYSGTCVIWTPWDQPKVSRLSRCPDFPGQLM